MLRDNMERCGHSAHRERPRTARLARVVALRGIASRHAAAKGFHALCRAAVGETFRHDPALRLLLQRVVADRLGGAHALLKVALLDDRTLFVAGSRAPHAGITVGLM